MLTAKEQDVRQVAQRTVTWLSEAPSESSPTIGEIWHGTYRAVEQTAEILRDALQAYGVASEKLVMHADKRLNPDTTLDRAVTNELAWSLKQMLMYRAHPRDDAQPAYNAILVVGHQPQLSHLIHRVLGRDQPIERAELVCFAIEHQPHHWQYFTAHRLPWAISPPDTTTTEELYEKIKSKMQLTGFLGGIITGVLGLLLDPDKLRNLQGESGIVYAVGVALMLLGLLLYFAAMYAYDRLLMPVRFWSETMHKQPPKWLVQRPPSPALWVLYQYMLRIWNGLFIPATVAVVVGLGSLLISPFLPEPWKALVAAAVFLLIAVGVYLWYRYQRPALGPED